MTASAMMMQACLLQQQQASMSAALGFPGYLGLSPLFNNFLSTSSLLGEFPRSPFLGDSSTPLSSLLSALPADNKSHRSVAFLTLVFPELVK